VNGVELLVLNMETPGPRHTHSVTPTPFDAATYVCRCVVVKARLAFRRHMGAALRIRVVQSIDTELACARSEVVRSICVGARGRFVLFLTDFDAGRTTLSRV